MPGAWPDQEGVVRSTQTSSVYDQIRSDIVGCRIQPGEKLQMDRLRVAYGVGLSPLREALNRLSTEGLVTQIDQRGFRAAAVSLSELEDVTQARKWIGAAALRASIERGDAAWEEEILLALHRWERGLREEGAFPIQMHRRHSAFHRALLAACGSEWMLGFWDKAFDFAQRYQVMSLRLGAAPEDRPARDPVTEHRKLMQAVLDRDVERAIALHDDHLDLTVNLIRNMPADVRERFGLPGLSPTAEPASKP